MAQLDPLLQALVDRGAEALLLVEGERPQMRLGGEVRPVSQQSLTRPQIAALLAELGSQVDAATLASGQPARFVYQSPSGTPFLCESRGAGGTLEAKVIPHTGGDSTHGSQPEPPPPAPEASVPVAAASPTPPPAAPAEAAAPAAKVSVAPAGGPGPEIERYLRTLVNAGASDLHLSSDEAPMLRKDGEMTRIEGLPAFDAHQVRTLLEPILPEHNQREFQETNDTDFAYEIPGVARFRANFFMDRKGPGAVFRVIPSEILTAEQLGLPQAVLNLCQLSKGLVLVTGPTGSGKSTTLAAMIDHINRSRSDHIITIEDPIEFVHQNRLCLVNQREVVSHTRGFKPALRAALREDPDIVLVGEMRDLETIAIAIETAETGHLVFGTLHTTTAISTVDRIIDQFPSDRQAQIRTMLSESIKGVVSQTLVKRIGGGRVAALEVLIVTVAIANLIREGKTFQVASLMQTGKKLGMALLNDALLDLVRKKIVTAEDAYLKAMDKAGLASQLRAAGVNLKLETNA